MKEVVKVSISGISFAFEQDAYVVLNNYLERLESGYANNPDGREIIADIEARIVEIILSKQTTEQGVVLAMANKIVEQLGFPDDIAQGQQGESSAAAEQFPRRLYRNPEGAKLGGVCSGIATFFNADTVWVRLAFFAPLFLLILTAPMGVGRLSGLLGTCFGAFFLLYFVLWLVIPIAKTPRQKLEMRGEKITASSIHENFRMAASSMSPSPHSQRSASVLAEVVYVLGRIVLFGIKAVALIVGFIIALVGITLLIGYFTVSFGSDDTAMRIMEAFDSLHGVTPEIFLTLAALLALLPITLIVWFIMRLLFKIKINRTTMSIILGIWVIIVIYITILSIKNFENIRQGIKSASHIEVVAWQLQEDGYGDSDGSDSTDINALSAAIVTEGVVQGDSTSNDTVKIVVKKQLK